MRLLKVMKSGVQTAGCAYDDHHLSFWREQPVRDWICFVLRSKAVEATAEIVAVTNRWMLTDSSASCESQISSCLSVCQHEEKHAVSVEMLFWNVGDGPSVEVQQQIVSVVSGRPNHSEVIKTFWLHFRTSHLGIKFFEDLNLLGCDTTWVCEWLLTFLLILCDWLLTLLMIICE
jgi:hypothetical protein